MKAIVFKGTSLDDLRDFPDDVRREAGFQLDKVQHGLDPSNWKAMPSIGSGVREIRIRDRTGAYRIIYVATLVDAFYVLTAFRNLCTNACTCQFLRCAVLEILIYCV